MKSVFVVGYMGTGKSTLGRKLADCLGFDFLDTDIFIENRFRQRILDMFAEVGEETFRRRERIVMEELAGIENTVVATGGGLPCYHDNMALLKDSGLVLFLEADASVLAARLELCKRTRPTIADKSGEELLSYVTEALRVRNPIYRQAHLTISVNQVMTDEDELILARSLAKEIEAMLTAMPPESQQYDWEIPDY